MTNIKRGLTNILGKLENFVSILLYKALISIEEHDPRSFCSSRPNPHFDLFEYYINLQQHRFIVPSHINPDGCYVHIKHILKTWLNFNLRYKNEQH
jgi:hypothetical protein